MIDKLVVVDYLEGAGGEFFASFINAHWGQPISIDPQCQPNHHQKWFNTYSLIIPDWDRDFQNHVLHFLARCESNNLKCVAVPYHLYKWPHHSEILKTVCPNTRFVRIDSTGHEERLTADFKRKVINRVLNKDDFGEIQFFLKHQSYEHRKYCMELFKCDQLTLGKILPGLQLPPYGCQSPVTNEIVIDYAEFFIDFNKTARAYEQFCAKLDLTSDLNLLAILINRNKQNLYQQNLFLD